MLKTLERKTLYEQTYKYEQCSFYYNLKNYTDSAVFLVYEKNILFLFKQDLFLCF